MKILICGLGLIGGSFARAFKYYTENEIFAYDIDINTVRKAILVGACDDGSDKMPELSNFDVILLASYPRVTVDFIEKYGDKINKNTLVIDFGGIKRKICEYGFASAEKYGYTFIGGHPMAGTQFSGFTSSKETMFKNATMLLVPKNDIEIEKLDFAVKLFKSIGFSSVKVTDAEKHDRMIAYTSQLAHIVSNAYVKSPNAREQKDYSAGSFKDLTRVAHLNADMWSDLFMQNSDMLSFEIDNIINELSKYSKALKEKDVKVLHKLLEDGSRINDEIKAD